MIGQIILQLVLIALNAVFACAEIAVLSMNENKLTKLASDGNKKALKIKKLTSQPAKFLATIQVAITLSGFMGSAFAADNFSAVLVDGLVNLGLNVPVETLETISVVVITILLSFITLVFGELVPKRLAMRKAESLGLALAGLVSFISTAFAPIVWLLTASTNGILRLLGIDPNAEENEVSEEDIRMMAYAGREKGVIKEAENDIIQNVFDFDDTSVGEIMTHRTEMDLLDADDSVDEWKNIIFAGSHIFYPICKNTSDNIVAILDTRKFFRLKNQEKNNVLENATTKPLFVSSHLKADDMFRKMKKKQQYFAVVVDEFGGTDGIVTVNDLIDELVGDIENSESEILKLENGTYEIECNVEVSKFEKVFNITLDTDSVTLSGWIIEHLGKVPKKDFTFTYEKLSFTIIKRDEKRVIKAIIKEKTE